MPGILNKLGSLRDHLTRIRQDEAKYHLTKLLEKYDVDLDHIGRGLGELAEVDRKAAVKIKKLVDAVAQLHEVNIDSEEGLEDLKRQLELSGKRLDKWSGRLGKVKDFITDHVGEISASVLGIQGLKTASESLDAAVDTMVSTTGELGDNWDSATGHALRMSTQLTQTQVAASGLVKDLDSVTEWQRKYYQLFRDGGDATKAIKGMAALTHSFGVDLSEMTELMESRQKNFNQTAEQTTDELAGIHSEFRKLYEGIDRTGSAAQKSARIWEKDYYSVVKEAAGEISESGTDMYALSKILGTAYESANKLNVSYTKGKEVLSDVGRLFKLPETMKVEGVSEILSEIKTARAKGPKAEDEVFKSYFRDVDVQLTKDIVSQIESGQLTSQMGASLLFEKMGKTGKGLARTLTLQKRYLTELGDVNAQLKVLESYGIKPGDTYLVRKLVMDGSLDKVLKEMDSGQSIDDALGKIKGLTDDDKKRVAENLGQLQSDASITWKSVTQSAEALIKNPVISLVGSMAIFTGSAIIRGLQNRAILASLTAQKASVDALAMSKGGIPGVGGGVGGGGIPGVGSKAGGVLAEATEAAKGAGTGVRAAEGAAAAASSTAGGASAATKGVGRLAGLARLGKGLGGAVLKKVPLIGTVATVGLGALEVKDTLEKGDTRGAAIKGTGVAGGALGGWGGAALGAAIGTAIFPGIGTIVGGLIGGIGGVIGGEKLTEKIAETIAGPEMGSKEKREELFGLNPRSVEALASAMSSYNNPEEIASTLSKKGANDPRSGAARSPRDMKMKFTPKGLLPDGTLTAEWTNPEIAATMFSTYVR